jgi:hypothetical protein
MVGGHLSREGEWDTGLAGLAPSSQTVESNIRVSLLMNDRSKHSSGHLRAKLGSEVAGAGGSS